MEQYRTTNGPRTSKQTQNQFISRPFRKLNFHIHQNFPCQSITLYYKTQYHNFARTALTHRTIEALQNEQYHEPQKSHQQSRICQRNAKLSQRRQRFSANRPAASYFLRAHFVAPSRISCAQFHNNYYCYYSRTKGKKNRFHEIEQRGRDARA